MAYIGTSPTQAVRTRFLYTATASQTTFSGADTQNLTLRYSDANFVDVYQNGVLLKGGGADYTATTTTSVVLATGATADDVIEIIVYDVFAVANLIKKDGDTVEGVINFNGKEITLDADFDTSITADTDDQIDFKIGGTDVATFTNSSSDFVITQAVQDKDIIFKGDDGGSAITALTLDMSEAGNASFNGTVTAAGGSSNNNDDANILTLNATQHARLLVDTASTSGHRASLVLESNGQETTLGTTGSASELAVPTGDLTLDVDGNIILNADGAIWKFEDGTVEIFQITSGSQNANLISMVQDKDIRLQGYDGSSLITAVNLDMSDAGHATFNNGITLSDGDLNVASGHGISFGHSTSSTTGVSVDTTTLREYEEGTWTPVATDSDVTLATAEGSYTRIGRSVYITAIIAFPTTSDGNAATIGNFPYTCQNGNKFRGAMSFGFNNKGDNDFTLLMSANTDTAQFHTLSGGGVAHSSVSGKTFVFSGFYPTAS